MFVSLAEELRMFSLVLLSNESQSISSVSPSSFSNFIFDLSSIPTVFKRDDMKSSESESEFNGSKLSPSSIVEFSEEYSSWL